MLLGLSLPDSIASLGGNIRRRTEGKPDLASSDAVGNCLNRGHPADVTEHQVVREHATIVGSEFVGDRQPELAHTHATTLAAEENAPVRETEALLSGLPRNEVCVEFCDEFVGQGIWDAIEALADGKAVTHLAHNYRDRSS
jgi:hypothetical protein